MAGAGFSTLTSYERNVCENIQDASPTPDPLKTLVSMRVQVVMNDFFVTRRLREWDVERLEKEFINTAEMAVLDFFKKHGLPPHIETNLNDVIWDYLGENDEGPIVVYTPYFQKRLATGESIESIEGSILTSDFITLIEPLIEKTVQKITIKEERRLQRQLGGTCEALVKYNQNFESDICVDPEVSKACADDTQWYEVDHDMSDSEDSRLPEDESVGIETGFVPDNPDIYVPRQYPLFDVCTNKDEHEIVDLRMRDYPWQRIANALGWTQTNSRLKVAKIYKDVVSHVDLHEFIECKFYQLDVEWLMNKIRSIPNIERIMAGQHKYATADIFEPFALNLMQRNGKIAVIGDRYIWGMRFYDGCIVPFRKRDWRAYTKQRYWGYILDSGF
jgi:hypothetical protein